MIDKRKLQQRDVSVFKERRAITRVSIVSIARVRDLAKRRKLRDRVSRGCRLRSKRKCHRLQPEDDDPLAPLPHFFRPCTPPVATAAATTPTNFSSRPSATAAAVAAAAFRDISVRARTASSHPRQSVLVARGYAVYLPLSWTHVHVHVLRRVETRNVRREIACAFRNVIGASKNR